MRSLPPFFLFVLSLFCLPRDLCILLLEWNDHNTTSNYITINGYSCAADIKSFSPEAIDLERGSPGIHPHRVAVLLDLIRKTDNSIRPLLIARGYILDTTIAALVVGVIVLIAIAAMWMKRHRVNKDKAPVFNCTIANESGKSNSSDVYDCVEVKDDT